MLHKIVTNAIKALKNSAHQKIYLHIKTREKEKDRRTPREMNKPFQRGSRDYKISNCGIGGTLYHVSLLKSHCSKIIITTVFWFIINS